MKTKLLLIVTFLLFSLGQLARISFLNQEINIYGYEFLMIVTLFYFFVIFRLSPLKNAFKSHKVIFLFLASLLFSYVLSFSHFNLLQNGIAFLYLLRLISYISYFLYLSYYLRNKKIKGFLGKPIQLLFLITLIASFSQFIFYPDLRNLIYLGWDPHFHRMFGTFFDTSIASAVFGLSFLFILVSARNYSISFLFLLASILTFSRSGYLALFLTLVYFLFSKKMIRYGIIITVVFILLLVFVPKQFGQGVGLTRTFSITSRLDDYKEGVQIWLKNPVFGIGYNRLRYMREQLQLITKEQIPSHAAASLSSSYLIMLICGGIVGFALFLASAIRIAMIRKEITVLIVFLAVLSLSDNILLHPFIMFLLGSFIVSINLSYTLRK